MFIAIACLGIVGCVLLASEYLWRTKRMQSELSRKFVHIIVGTFVASWAFFLSVEQIQLLSIVLLLGVLLSKRFSIFSAVHSVSRKTWGEPFFALAVGLTITFASSPYIYAAAILHLSLADGLAAIVGVKYGKKTGYKIFGHYKTILGTVIFYLCSVAITFWLIMSGPDYLAESQTILLLLVPLVSMLMENISSNGTDNIIVPISVLSMIELLA